MNIAAFPSSMNIGLSLFRVDDGILEISSYNYCNKLLQRPPQAVEDYSHAPRSLASHTLRVA